MTHTQDKLLQKQTREKFNRYYVPIAPGNNAYFPRYSQARKFARSVGAEVKPLD